MTRLKSSIQEVLPTERAACVCTIFRSPCNSRTKSWIKANWFQIRQEAWKWQQVWSKEELHVSAPAEDASAVVDPWHRAGTRLNTISGLLIKSKKDQILKDVQKLFIIQAYFTGPADEPKEAIKRRCETIKEAFLELFTCLRLLQGRQRWSHPILKFSHWEKFKIDWNFYLTHSKPMAQLITKARL